MRDEAEIRDELERLRKCHQKIEAMCDRNECSNPLKALTMLRHMDGVHAVMSTLAWMLEEHAEQSLRDVVDEWERLVEEVTA